MKKIFWLLVMISTLGLILSGCSSSAEKSAATSIPGPAPTSISPDKSVAPPDNLSQVVPITVSEPTDGAILTDSAVAVKGQTKPGAVVTVNDQTDIADSSGSFSIPLRLDDGTNFIDVLAADESGNEGEVLISVEVDPNSALGAEISAVAPGDSLPLTVTEPKDNSTVKAGTIMVKGMTSPQAIVSVNDQADYAGGDGSFSFAVGVDEGPNLLDIVSSNDNADEVEVLLLVNAIP